MLELQYFTGGLASTNGFYVTKGETSIVVDAPEGMKSWLESIAAEPKALLLTHAHFDHVLDAAAVHERWQCPIYAFAEPTPDLTLERFFSAFGTGMAVPSYSVDHLVNDQSTLTLGDFSLLVRHIPGHSDDSIVFIEPKDQLIFGGDVLMAGGIGRSDFPNGDQDLLCQGIREKLYDLDDAFTLWPGHGPSTTVGDEKRSNPFVRAQS